MDSSTSGALHDDDRLVSFSIQAPRDHKVRLCSQTRSSFSRGKPVRRTKGGGGFPARGRRTEDAVVFDVLPREPRAASCGMGSAVSPAEAGGWRLIRWGVHASKLHVRKYPCPALWLIVYQIEADHWPRNRGYIIWAIKYLMVRTSRSRPCLSSLLPFRTVVLPELCLRWPHISCETSFRRERRWSERDRCGRS